MALAAPTVRGGAQVVYGNNNWATIVQGVTPDYLTIRDYTMQSGQFFTDAGCGRRRQESAVLGKTVAENLFGDADPTGQVIIIKNVPFTVVGVLDAEGPVADRPGSGRRDPAADLDGQAEGPRRQQGECAGRSDP